MKTKNLFLLVALLFGIIAFSGCKKDNDDENTHNNNSEISGFYALDISEETDWDYVVAAGNEEGSSVWFNVDGAVSKVRYPNPATDYLYIHSESSLIQHVSLTNLFGVTLLSQEFVSDKIDISVLPVGVYILSVKTDKEIYRQKIMKK